MLRHMTQSGTTNGKQAKGIPYPREASHARTNDSGAYRTHVQARNSLYEADQGHVPIREAWYETMLKTVQEQPTKCRLC